MCVVLVPNIGINTSVSNTTKIRPQHFRILMCVHVESAWCQCQFFVLEPPYPTLHNYTHSNSETSCVCTGNVHGASAKFWSQNHHVQNYTNIYTHSNSETSCMPTGNVRGSIAKYWFQNHHIQHYTNMPTALHKVHVCPLGMWEVLVPNIGLRTTISNTTQNTHSNSEILSVCTGNVHGASAKFWFQIHHIQHYTNKPTALGMSMVLVPNSGISTNIFNATQIRLQQFRNFMCPLRMCLVLVPNFGLRTTIPKQYTNTPTALQKLHVCPLGMRVVLLPYIGTSTSIFNTTQIRPQQFRNFMRVHWECAWCQCQILVLEPPYSTLHKNAHSTSETSCVCTGNVHGASAKYWSENHYIQHYTNTPTANQKLNVLPLRMCVVLTPNICISTSTSNSTQKRPQYFRNFMRVHWEYAWCQCQILVLEPPYPTLHKYTHSNSETSCMSTGNVHGASTKYLYEHQYMQ